MSQSKSEHALELVQELLDDLELSRNSVENLILKTSRLARITGASEVQKWLKFELGGYKSNDEVSLKYMGLTGRWIDKVELKGYWMPAAHIEALIITEKEKLSVMRIPEAMAIPVTRAMNETTQNIAKYSGIRSKIIAQLHNFVTEIYYEKLFDNLSESIFESYKREVDSLIAASCGDVIEQIPHAIERLGANTDEAISHALTTCRRIIESFADSIFPPTEDTINIGGNEIKLDAAKHQNRINAFIHNNCRSTSRKTRFRQNLSNLFDRVSTGVHSDVTAEEAKALFLNTYLFLGEVLHLTKNTNQKINV